MTFGEKYAEQARQWLGVTYQHRGCGRGGCDCTGLLLGVARELGYLLRYELRKYPEDWNLHGMADDYISQQMELLADQITAQPVQAGDILIFHFGRCLAHCGIMVDPAEMAMVHCYRTSRQVAYAIVRNSRWSRQWRQTWRFNEQKILQYI
jgi:cell wall-associated NlpC family hydrolase